MSYTLSTIQGSTTAGFGVDLYLVDASGGSITVTLPDTTGNIGSIIQFKRSDWASGNTVTIIPNPSDGSFIEDTITSLPLNPGNWVFLFVDSNSSWQFTDMDFQDNAIFGNGSDGVVAINSNTTLSRDMYYSQLDITSGAIVSTNGFRIFVRDRLTMTGNGTTIRNNGGNANGATAGAAAPSGSVGGGFAGAAGTSASLPGTQGNPTTVNPESVGGAGGAGGAAGAIAGGAGGVNTPPSAAAGGTECTQQLSNAVIARDNAGIQLIGGSSGGSGGSGLLSTSGGGGGSAGIIVIAARSIKCDSKQSCTITAKGGNGGNGSGTGAAGGGGGGAGGCVIIITRIRDLLNNLPGMTMSAAGGAAGLGANGGANGTAGSAGTLKYITDF